MLSWVIRRSVRFRGVVIALACMVIAYGIYSIFQARLDVFPEFAPPEVVIQTEAPGLAPEEVETLVTQPIENAMAGAIGLKSIRSQSIQGLSVITLIFDASTSIYRARQLVTEQLNTIAGQMPRGVHPPAMTPLSSSTSTILGIGLTSKTQSQMTLRTLADWMVKPHLLSVRGVAGVNVFGGDIKQFQVQVDPQALIRYGISLQEVEAAASRATGVRGAGYIENTNQRITLASRLPNLTVAQLGQTPVRSAQAGVVRLADVAHIAIAPAPAIGGALINGQPGVILMVNSQFGGNPLEVTLAVERALNQIKPMLAANGVTLHPDLFRPINYILACIGHLRTALLLGSLLVVIVLFLFLFNIRTAFISATAIPLSLLMAVIVLTAFDVSLNTMTLGGLAIALGEVVDDAIVDTENIFRRLRQNQLLGNPLPFSKVIIDASIEVRSAVVYATFIVVLVFLPMMGISGVAGKLFAPLGLAYILAILASLVTALTLTPALSALLFRNRQLEAREPVFIQRLKAAYARTLHRVDRHLGIVMVALIIACVASLASIPFLGNRFLPPLREGHYIVHMASAPGTSMLESLRLGRLIAHDLGEVKNVRAVAQRAGRSEEWVDTTGPHYSEIDVDLTPGLGGKSQAQVLTDIQQVLKRYTGVVFTVQTFLTERVDETISGFTAQVAVNIAGSDLDVIDGKAAEVARVLGATPGAVGVQVQAPEGEPELRITPDPEKLSRYGIAPVDALDAIQAAYEGVAVAQTYEGNRVFDVTVVLDPADRHGLAGVQDLPLKGANGVMVPLKDVATIRQVPGRYAILHAGAQRMQTVTANVKGRDVRDFVRDAKARVEKLVRFPVGTYAAFTGEAEAQDQSQHDLGVKAAMAGVGILLLLALALKNGRGILLVLVNFPFALIGGVLIVWCTGKVLTLGSMIGFVTLFGITLRNSIMLLSHYEHLVLQEGATWNVETAMQGAVERLTPILMTALVTALGLLPLAWQQGEPGNEIEGPMAMVILGGLITSTALNLLVLPVLAQRYARFRKHEED